MKPSGQPGGFSFGFAFPGPDMDDSDGDKIFASFDRRLPNGQAGAMRVSLSRFNGRPLVHIREWAKLGKGRWIPTKSGFAISAGELDSTIRALKRARREVIGTRASKPVPCSKPAPAISESCDRLAPPWECWPDE